eukprot:s609_g12.t2
MEKALQFQPRGMEDDDVVVQVAPTRQASECLKTGWENQISVSSDASTTHSLEELSAPQFFTKQCSNIDVMTSRVVRESSIQQAICAAVADGQVSVTVADPRSEDAALIAISEQFESMTGYCRQEILGKNCRFLNVGCDCKPGDLLRLRRSVETGEPFTGVLENRRKPGGQGARTRTETDTQAETMLVPPILHQRNFPLPAPKLVEGRQRSVASCPGCKRVAVAPLALLAAACLPQDAGPREPKLLRQRLRLGQRLRSSLLKARRRWGLGLVRLVVSLVVGVELMAVQDAETATNLVQDCMEAASKGVQDFTNKKDYKFGDITKAAMSKFASSLTSSVSSYTGKEKYEFGDITKATVSKFTGKEDYKFGDITKAAADKISGAASSAVKQITGKDDYEFGDITSSLVSRVTGARKDEDGATAERSGELFRNLLDLCGLTVARNPFNGAELWFLVGIQADVSALDEISLHKAEQEVHRVANDIRSRLADQLSALAISGALMSNFEVSDEGNYLRSREYSKPRDLDPEVWSLLPTPQWKSGAIPATPPVPVSETALSGNARALLVRVKQESQEEVCTARCWPMVYMGVTAVAIALGLAVAVQHKNMRTR